MPLRLVPVVRRRREGTLGAVRVPLLRRGRRVPSSLVRVRLVRESPRGVRRPGGVRVSLLLRVAPPILLPGVRLPGLRRGLERGAKRRGGGCAAPRRPRSASLFTFWGGYEFGCPDDDVRPWRQSSDRWGARHGRTTRPIAREVIESGEGIPRK